MWELYAVWTWVPAFTLAATGAATLAAFVAFATIAVGGVGSLVAGALADRVGRTAVTAVSLAISGGAILLAGVAFGAPTPLLAAFLLVWGFVVADSAAVTELAEPRYVGSALTFQTAVGFLLTIGSIQLTPAVAEAVGWQWAFAPLVVGPIVGTAAVLGLRASPAAAQLAGGNR
jgi:MFS family permease